MPPFIDNENYMNYNKLYQNNFGNNREYYYEQKNVYY